MNMRRSILSLATLVGSLALLVLPPPAQGTHIPTSLDIPTLRPEDGKYLNFVEPGPVPGLFEANTGAPSGTEDFTGWTHFPIPATGDTNDFPIDFGLTHGDRADFDWVVENRGAEFGGVATNHPIIGAMTWEIAPTTPSAHLASDGITVHSHLGLLPTCPDGSRNLCNPDFDGTSFTMVDVFSAISFEGDPLVTDTEAVAREAALDYVLTFCAGPGVCVPGIPVAVWTLGWHPLATSDDFVARWVSPFAATHVLIEPPLFGFGHDEIVQIDAIKAVVPEPTSLLLLGSGLAGLAGLAASRARRRG